MANVKNVRCFNVHKTMEKHVEQINALLNKHFSMMEHAYVILIKENKVMEFAEQTIVMIDKSFKKTGNAFNVHVTSSRIIITNVSQKYAMNYNNYNIMENAKTVNLIQELKTITVPALQITVYKKRKKYLKMVNVKVVQNTLLAVPLIENVKKVFVKIINRC